MTLLSIIIPHYNSWKELNELLQSIYVNNLKNVEVIVVDDWTENREYYIEKLKKKYPNTLFFSNSNEKKGAGSARNIGLEHAKGKWLLFADADDKFIPDFYSIIKDFFNSKYDIIFFPPNSFSDNKEKELNRHKMYKNYVDNYLVNPSRYNELKLRYFFVVPWSKLIRHEIVKNNNIKFEEVMVSNDVLFSAKIGYTANIITSSKKTIYKVRESDNSLTSNTTQKKFKIRFNVWVNYVLFLKKSLTISDYQILNITAMPQLINVIKSNLSIQNIFYIYKKCKKFHIPLIDKRIFKPKFVLKKIKENK